MSLILRNVTATFFGTALVGVMSIVLAPFVLKSLGVEAYGALGILITLQGLVMPLGTAFNSVAMREIAGLRRRNDSAGERAVVATFDMSYAAAALAVAVILAAAAPLIARFWMDAVTLSSAHLTTVLHFIALAVALQLPIAGYSGGLMGLERHILSNTINGTAALIRAGVAIALMQMSASITALFAWLAIAAVFHCLVLVLVTRWVVPGVPAPRFDAEILRRVKPYARAVVATTALGTVLSQLDKVTLSRFVSLDVFGLYSLAATLATATGIAVAAVSFAFFPRFAAASVEGDGGSGELVSTYHRAAQLMAVLLLPVGGILMVFPREILQLWTGNAAVAVAGAPFLALLTAGAVLNGLVAVPYSLLVAAGQPQIWVRVNLVALFFAVPLMIVAAKVAGGVGTASVWIGINAAYMFLAVPLAHRTLLRSEYTTWLLRDVGVPCLTATAALAACRLLMPEEGSMPTVASGIAAAWLLTGGAVLAVEPHVRTALVTKLRAGALR